MGESVGNDKYWDRAEDEERERERWETKKDGIKMKMK